MRWLAIFCLLGAPALARADCPPPTQGSADRALSDVPYAAPKVAPCAAQPGDRESWAAPRDERREAVTRAGLIGITVGAGLLFLGANLAICAHHAPAGTATGCRDGAAPVLIGGAAAATFGLGALGFATWFMRDAAPDKSTALSAGLSLRLAWN